MKTVYLMLIAALCLTSCSKDDDDAAQPNNSSQNNNTSGNSITINSNAQVWMKIDGNVYSKIVEATNTISSGVGADKEIAGFPDTSSAIYASFLYDDNTLNSYFSIDKGELIFLGGEPDTTTFKNFFNPGNYSYTAGALNGIVIAYYDSNNERWSTDQGSGDQTGSIFTITEIKTNNVFDYTVTVRVTFNCKVYNNTGQSKTLTEGVYIGGFANI